MSADESATPVALKEAHVRSFRASRACLIRGAEDVPQAASAILGAQAQVASCACWALSMRTKGRPVAEAIEALACDDRQLVRTWQRDTLHLYVASDWPLVIAARPRWVTSGRRGGEPGESLLEEAAKYFEERGVALTRSALFGLLPEDFVAVCAKHPAGKKNPRRFGATRVVEHLARRGVIGFDKKQGREQSYIHRSAWTRADAFLDWRERDADAAAAEAALRYLSAFGPSSIHDIAHYFGARIGETRRFMSLVREETVRCSCPGHGEDLLARAEDLEALLDDSAQEWPARLLPAYDTMLMTHRDKRWILPDPDEEPRVWGKAAIVRAVVLDGGAIAATWSHKTTSKTVDIVVEPLSG